MENSTTFPNSPPASLAPSTPQAPEPINGRDFDEDLKQQAVSEAITQELRDKEAQERNTPPPLSGEASDFDLREEVTAQIHLLKAVREHLFYPNGKPREGTEATDISSYMGASLKLLSMLQRFEEALKTDADFNRVQTAIEMAMEDCNCPSFVTALEAYLADETGAGA